MENGELYSQLSNFQLKTIQNCYYFPEGRGCYPWDQFCAGASPMAQLTSTGEEIQSSALFVARVNANMTNQNSKHTFCCSTFDFTCLKSIICQKSKVWGPKMAVFQRFRCYRLHGSGLWWKNKKQPFFGHLTYLTFLHLWHVTSKVEE